MKFHTGQRELINHYDLVIRMDVGMKSPKTLVNLMNGMSLLVDCIKGRLQSRTSTKSKSISSIYYRVTKIA